MGSNNSISKKNITISSYPNKKENKNNIWIKFIIGVVVGFINGFWGGGGGMICVPALTSIIKVPEKIAHASTILIMLPLCLTSFITYVIVDGIILDNYLTISVGFVVGGIIGSIILNKLNNTFLQLLFSIIIIVSGIKLIL